MENRFIVLFNGVSHYDWWDNTFVKICFRYFACWQYAVNHLHNIVFRRLDHFHGSQIKLVHLFPQPPLLMSFHAKLPMLPPIPAYDAWKWSKLILRLQVIQWYRDSPTICFLSIGGVYKPSKLDNSGPSPCSAPPPAHPLVLTGMQTGQSCRLHCFQWSIICLEEEQWGTWHVLPSWQEVMWSRAFFMVRQWGRVHWRTSWVWGCCCCCSLSRRWHFWACSRSTSCCWISFLSSGAPWGPPAAQSPAGDILD